MDIDKSLLVPYWVWDIETFKHTFTFSIVRADGKFARKFQVNKYKNDWPSIKACMLHLQTIDAKMVGFNSLAFDYPIIHDLILDAKIDTMSGAVIAKLVHKLAQKQIDSFRGDGFGRTISLEDRLVKQVDLYKIWHFDNKAKATGLKTLEFNMRLEDLQDLPFGIEEELDEKKIEKILKYNFHDVDATLKFFLLSFTQVQFRESLTAKYGRDFTNANDGKIGKDYFQMKLEQENVKLKKYVDGKLKMIQSKRSSIEIGECLFGYYQFNQPAFRAVLDWFAKQSISETKGVFTEIPEHRLGDVAKYAEMETLRKKFQGQPTEDDIKAFNKEYPLGWVEEVELKGTYVVKHPDGTKEKKHKISYYKVWREATCLNVVINGFRFDFGTGGIHGSLSGTVVRAIDGKIIKDADV